MIQINQKGLGHPDMQHRLVPMCVTPDQNARSRWPHPTPSPSPASGVCGHSGAYKDKGCAHVSMLDGEHGGTSVYGGHRGMVGRAGGSGAADGGGADQRMAVADMFRISIQQGLIPV